MCVYARARFCLHMLYHFMSTVSWCCLCTTPTLFAASLKFSCLLRYEQWLPHHVLCANLLLVIMYVQLCARAFACVDKGARSCRLFGHPKSIVFASKVPQPPHLSTNDVSAATPISMATFYGGVCRSPRRLAYLAEPLSFPNTACISPRRKPAAKMRPIIV